MRIVLSRNHTLGLSILDLNETGACLFDLRKGVQLVSAHTPNAEIDQLPGNLLVTD